MKRIILLIAFLAMTGCADTLGKINAIEKGLIEPNVDLILDQTVDRLCKLPPDIMVRAIDRRGPELLDAIDGLCPDYSKLFDAANRRSPL